ncbi:MAG: hypothetical protein KJ626_03515 [Verrucomicrobia bacterium]|nr:hypothetical protein [Verrucomicrobiota bacterium]
MEANDSRTRTRTAQAQRKRTGRLTLYHPNVNGTGSAVQFELRLNRGDEQGYDCVFLEMAQQKTTAGNGEPATFDWANKIVVKLDFLDISNILTVLDGKSDALGSNGRGLYHEARSANTLIGLKKRTQGDGFILNLSKKSRSGEQIFKGFTSISSAEAHGLCCVLQTALFFMVFSSSVGLASNTRDLGRGCLIDTSHETSDHSIC